ncbi:MULTISPECIES: ornithine carbamoyltransferase [unclassified Prochlorococcus]|uniref:ornithine carbamoyltransferase n=1 Tax=unclassified Prochlorococcus TaxID=2627481 RepID=UPI00053394A8|nr:MULTISPECIES: ornithine carbamoyltransferase [unclassified Prochlorococcus]KGG16309.1 Ornithine carbamoyltransferase [Prochlorococcus sp. MIT 0603]KGG17957.1 Ornithine carbamoyltransferase [Prochlorococcus sp. MIT 0602]
MEMVSESLSRILADLKGKSFISCNDLNAHQIEAIHKLALQLKNGERKIDLGGRVLGLIFSKASTRTRVSFQVAMTRLGGQTIDINQKTSQLGRGEPLKDTARVLSRYCDALAIRTYGNDELIEYVKWSSIPVLNALTDLEHPCQALADFLTMKEVFGKTEGLTLTYLGDGNNVAHSLMLCGALLGVNVRISCPKGFEPIPSVIDQAKALAKESGSNIEISHNPLEAVNGSNVIYTDVWASMGQEKEQLHREEAFKDFTLDNRLVDKADSKAIVLHCLPAHRGEEISDEVLEGKRSRVFDQAENRLHVQQALLAALLGGL